MAAPVFPAAVTAAHPQLTAAKTPNAAATIAQAAKNLRNTAPDNIGRKTPRKAMAPKMHDPARDPSTNIVREYMKTQKASMW